MVKLLVLYKHPKDPDEFDRLYRDTHVPLVRKIPGLVKTEVAKITGAPPGQPKPEYYQVAALYFDSMQALGAAMNSPEGKAAGENIFGFAKDIMSMTFADVVVEA